MGLLKIFVILTLFSAIGIQLFVSYALSECKDYKFENQKGKIFIVTGGNSGLGFETALDLARVGGTVIIATRNEKNGLLAKESILKQVPGANVDFLLLDLSSFESIRNFAKNFEAKYHHFDVLINNAGIMALPKREVTKDGIEAQIGTNHFGHFLLTSLLFPIINQNGRIINHASSGHLYASVESMTNDLFSEKSYDPWIAYGHSKAANLLFTYEMVNRLKNNNPKNIKVIAVHPGYSATNLQTGKSVNGISLELLNEYLAMSAHDGSLSQTEAATGKNVESSMNNYIGPKYVAFGVPSVQSTLSQTHDVKLMKSLWEQSVKLTGAKNFL